jgi:hypothetical protein
LRAKDKKDLYELKRAIKKLQDENKIKDEMVNQKENIIKRITKNHLKIKQIIKDDKKFTAKILAGTKRSR